MGRWLKGSKKGWPMQNVIGWIREKSSPQLKESKYKKK